MDLFDLLLKLLSLRDPLQESSSSSSFSSTKVMFYINLDKKINILKNKEVLNMT